MKVWVPLTFLKYLISQINQKYFKKYFRGWFHTRFYSQNDVEQRRRFKWSALAMLQVQFLGIIYYFVTGLFQKLPEEQQPVLAFVMAMIRYGSQKLLEVPTFKTALQIFNPNLIFCFS